MSHAKIRLRVLCTVVLLSTSACTTNNTYISEGPDAAPDRDAAADALQVHRDATTDARGAEASKPEAGMPEASKAEGGKLDGSIGDAMKDVAHDTFTCDGTKSPTGAILRRP